MANVKFDKKTFEKEIGKLTDELQYKIAMFGTPVEEVTKDEVELEIFPNRPDLLSYHGFKRGFLSFLEKTKGIKKYKLNKPKENFTVKIDSSVKDVRPFTACAIVKGLKLNDLKIKEIIELQEKLHNTIGRRRKKVAIGIYPLEKIELPITFKALEPERIKFLPLEAAREMTGIQILQKHPTGKEYAHLLSGKTKFPIFIDAKNNILSMPPIINSELTGRVTEKTKDVFIECSGNSFETLKKCLNIIVTTLIEMGGKVYQMELQYSKKEITPDFSNDKMKISLKNTNKLLGLDLTEKEIKQYLEKMGHNYDNKNVEVAPWRTDVLHEVDLIEDIAIAYGYENFKEEIPEISTIGKEEHKEIVKRKIAEILIGQKMIETSSYHLTTKKDQYTKMGRDLKNEKDIIELEESKTEYNILRENLSHYLIKIFSENVDAEYPQNIFETGKIFKLNKDGEIEENENLAISITPGNFTELKQILEYLGRMLDKKFKFEDSSNPPEHLINGRTAKIKLDNKTIGYIGEVHPKILKNWKLKTPIAILEINLELLF